MKKLRYLRVEKVGDSLVAMDIDGTVYDVRPHMLELAFDSNQAISFYDVTRRVRRVDIAYFNDQLPTEKEV